MVQIIHTVNQNRNRLYVEHGVTETLKKRHSYWEIR